MNARSIVRYGLLTLLTLGPAHPAAAQMGGLKKKLQERVEKAATQSVNPQVRPKGPIYNEHVLVMSPEVLDRFARALAAEEAKRTEVAGILRARPVQREAEAAARGSRAQAQRKWVACVQQVHERPEFRAQREAQQRSAAAMAEQVRAGTMDAQAAARVGAQMSEAMMTLNREMNQAVETSCGPAPEANPSSATETAPDPHQLAQQPAQAALQAGGFTRTQYAILKERIAPFCASPTTGSDGGVRIPGSDNQFYVYSPEEVEALRPRCETLMAALRGVL
jgi:hypothetical protein